MKNLILTSLFFSLFFQLSGQNQQVNVDLFWPAFSISNNLSSDNFKSYSFKLGYEQFKKEDLSIAYTFGLTEFQSIIESANGLNDSRYRRGNTKLQLLLKKYEEMPFSNTFKRQLIWGGFVNVSMIYQISTSSNPNFEDKSLYAPIIGGGVLIGDTFPLTSNLHLEMLTGVGLGYSLNSDLYEDIPDPDSFANAIAGFFLTGTNIAYILSPSFFNVNLCYRF